MIKNFKSTILGFAAGFAIVGVSSHASAQTCPNTRTYTDFIQTAPADSKRVGPNDCAVLKIATPILTWADKRDRDLSKQFEISVVREGGGHTKTYYTYDPRLLIPDPLAAGTYEWRVKYHRVGSSETSQGRRFIIPASGQFAIPTGGTIAGRVAVKGHPRTKVGTVELSRVAQLANYEFSRSYAAFLAKADAPVLVTDAELQKAPTNRTLDYFVQLHGASVGGAEYADWLLDVRDISMNQLKEIKILGYAFHFTRDRRYLNRGLERLQRLADWPSGRYDATSHHVQDQANREIFLALALGMDLFHEALSQPAYATWQGKILAKFKQRLDQVDLTSFNHYPRDSHLLTVSRYAMEALMYAVGTPGYNDSAAKAKLAKHWEMRITTLGSWGENFDGGFGNGEFYGWMNAIGLIQGATTARLVADVDLTKWDLVGKSGDYLIAITPPRILTRQHFGDANETRNLYQQYSKEVRLLAMLSKKVAYDWYWRQETTNAYYTHLDLGVEQYLALALHEGSPVFSSGTPALQNPFHFAEAGFVAMHSSTTEQLRSSVFFRSSSFGSFSHNHADQNSFTFTSKGQPLLINGGYYDYAGSPHHLFITRTTRFKNALTFDNGIGQSEPRNEVNPSNDGSPTSPGIPLDSSMPRGRIVRPLMDNGAWAVVVGDASQAYQGFDFRVPTSVWRSYISTAYRTVAYNRREGIVVIYDNASGPIARQWELNFHAINPPTIQNTTTGTLLLSNNGVTACMDVYGSGRTFRRSHFTEWPNLPGKYYDKTLIPGNKGNANGPLDWSSLVGKPAAPAVSSYISRPLQSHTIFYDSNKTTSVAAVTVIKEDCRDNVTVSWSGSQATVKINGGSPLIANGLSVAVPAQ